MDRTTDERVRKVDDGDLISEDDSSKRTKVAHDVINPTNDANRPELVITPASTEKSEQLDPICIVCMEEGSAESPLLDVHQCGQCSKDAWRICACCNETILSRTCPVCRGNYAPILLHVVPGKNIYACEWLYMFKLRVFYFDFTIGMPLNQLANKELATEAKSLLLYKFGIIRHLISKSNVAVWNPEQGKMHLSLPREFSSDTDEVCCLTVTIPMSADRIVNNTFAFNNSVWDEIESEVETGTSQTGDMKDSKLAVQWLLSFTRHEGHQILSMMTLSDWEQMMDPAKSTDTAEALQTITSNIVLGGGIKPSEKEVLAEA